ncbi:MAG: large conductance mechanosensitive channel protein MscL [Candidatus Gastranaerophilales bacterium]|nr:large conductance mechanosensitive channel protein MscL [Candidatus Gastranaerophilales bacterium]
MLKGFLQEFKEFAVKGNVIDMAVGIIIGGAFSPIVNSLVKDIIMPPIGFVMGKVDFSNLYFSITPTDEVYATLKEAQEAGLVTINYGTFINTLISFLIVSFAVFLLVKVINKLKTEKKEEVVEEAPAEPTTKECPFCCSEINIKATKCPHCASIV